MKNALKVGLALILVTLVASVWAFGGDDATQAELVKLVPNPAPGNAVAQGKPEFYAPDSLYKYMDGGADAFLLYDFRTLLHQEFKTKEADVTVDIFDMGTPENAFGMYASERSPGYHYILVGAEGYDNEGILNFLQGRYYVKLAGFGAGEDVLLAQFAKGITERIGGKAEMPGLLRLFPTAGLKAHTEQYLLKDPLGHPFLGPAYLAMYGGVGGDSTLLISVATDDADAKERLKLLAEHFKKSGQSEGAPEFGEAAIKASNSFEGKALAAARGRFVVVLLGPGNPDRKLFKETLARIQ